MLVVPFDGHTPLRNRPHAYEVRRQHLARLVDQHLVQSLQLGYRYTLRKVIRVLKLRSDNQLAFCVHEPPLFSNLHSSHSLRKGQRVVKSGLDLELPALIHKPHLVTLLPSFQFSRERDSQRMQSSGGIDRQIMPARVHDSQAVPEIFGPDVLRLNDDLSRVVDIPILPVLHNHKWFVLTPAKGSTGRCKGNQNQPFGEASPMFGCGGRHTVLNSIPETIAHKLNCMPE